MASSPETSGLLFTSDISCRILKSLLIYFRRQFGDDALRRAITETDFPSGSINKDFFENANNWVSFEAGLRLLNALTAASGDPDFPRKAGQITATKDVLGFTHSMMKAFGNPKLAYLKTLEASTLYNKVGVFEIKKASRSRVHFTYRSYLREPNRLFCEYRMGQFESFPKIWGLPPAQAKETSCQVNGAPCCTYEFSWLNRPSRLGLVVGAGAGVIGALAFSGGLNTDTPLSALMPLGAIIGALFGGLVEARFKIAHRDALLTEQQADVIRSLGDLHARYDELRQLNETLEEKVQERTSDLKVTSDKLAVALSRKMELDRAKTQFFTNISHELRTPLTLILAPLETVLSKPGELDPSVDRPELEIMYRNGLRLLRHINALLDISRLDASRDRLKLEDTRVPEMLRSLVDSSKGLANKKGVRLEFETLGEIPSFPIDRDKIEKIFLNLIANALAYTQPTQSRDARVKVTCKTENERFAFTVADTGIGIPSSELERIFDRFHQVEPTANGYGSTGIGLALVKELLEFHMGRIQVRSTVGVGSEFSVDLPLLLSAYPEERIDRRQDSQPVPVDRRTTGESPNLNIFDEAPTMSSADLGALEINDPNKPLILVVDDNADMLKYLRRLLAAEYRVRTAFDGEQAFRIAIQESPSLIISDLMMPRRGGKELIRDIARETRTRHIPIILLTAKSDVQAKIDGLEEGAHDFLTKPFHAQELRARVRSLLNQRKLEQELKSKNEYLGKLNFDLLLSKKEVFLQTIDALALAIDAKDPYTHGHSRRVSILSLNLAKEMGLSEADCEKTRIAAILHDIGKIGIPESVLTKPGKLTADEIKIINLHPVLGYRILQSVQELAPINHCILAHHERFDGQGYPEKRLNNDIPLEARIIAVADTYDAMTTDRCYRPALSHQDAIAELIRCSGRQFDPECVRFFLKMYQNNPPMFPAFPSIFKELVESPVALTRSEGTPLHALRFRPQQKN